MRYTFQTRPKLSFLLTSSFMWVLRKAKNKTKLFNSNKTLTFIISGKLNFIETLNETHYHRG